MKPIAGATAIFAGVLGVAVSVFRLIPYAEEYRVGVDDVAEVLAVGGTLVSFGAGCLGLLALGLGWVLRNSRTGARGPQV